jgi:hypothetical protein
MTQDEIIEMAKQAGIEEAYSLKRNQYLVRFKDGSLEVFAKLVAEAEREACAHKVEEFARKWWKIYCDRNLHYSSTLRAHQDFCALQAAIRARGEQA